MPTKSNKLVNIKGSLMHTIRWRCISIFMLFATVALQAGCGRINVEWTEEVKLHNGEVILVKRTATGTPLGEIGGPGGWKVKEMTLEVAETQHSSKPPAWRFKYVPVLFDYDSEAEEWFVVATFYTCQPWYELGRPDLPYVEYRVKDGLWHRVDLDSKLIGRKTNMLTGVRSSGEPSLLVLKDKQQRDRDAGKAYRHIVGEWHTTC